MQEVKVKKVELLKKLQENRKAHKETFDKACEGYRQEVIEKLDLALADAKKGKKINSYLRFEEPVNQTKDYDRAIMMVTMSVDDVLELTEHEFKQYVMDDWSWKDQFMTTDSVYLNKVKNI